MLGHPSRHLRSREIGIPKRTPSCQGDPLYLLPLLVSKPQPFLPSFIPAGSADSHHGFRWILCNPDPQAPFSQRLARVFERLVVRKNGVCLSILKAESTELTRS